MVSSKMLRLPILFSLIVAATALMMAAGCSYESSDLVGVQCDEDGMVSGDHLCRDGYWTIGGETILDAGDNDTGEDDVGCIPETDEELFPLCAAQNYECGTLETTDECGDLRTIVCGDCPQGQECHDDDNQCTSCPAQSNQALCNSLGLDCGVHNSLTDACGDERNNVNCGSCETTVTTEVISIEPFDCCTGSEICSGCNEVEITTRTCDDTTFICESQVETSVEPGDCDGCGDVCTATSSCQPPSANTCSASGHRALECRPGICDDGGAAVECIGDTSEPTFSDTETCNTGIDDGHSCEASFAGCQNPVSGFCSNQTCADLPCSGADDNCGCSDGNCADCSEENFFFATGQTTACPEVWSDDNCDEIAEQNHGCDSQQCVATNAQNHQPHVISCEPASGSQCEFDTNATQCTSQGLRDYDCMIWVCDGGSGECEIDTETHQLACDTADSDGTSCQLSPGAVCPTTGEEGICESGQCVDPCDNTDTSCGCGSGPCENCEQMDDEWQPTGQMGPCCGTHTNGNPIPCQCPQEERYIWQCQDNQCTLVATGEMRNGPTQNCDGHCGSDSCFVDESEGTACCLTGGATDCS